MCPDGQVYNLEVEGTHTYLADGVVAHNCHHATAVTYRRILEHLGAFAADGSGPLVLGVTATPERADKIGLGHVFEEIVYERGLVEMIAASYLCDLRGQVVGTDADLGRLRVAHGDFVDAEVAAELERSGALDQIAGAYAKYAADRNGLAFLPTVATAHELAGLLCGRGIAAEALDGTTPTETRRAILGRLHAGTTQVVANCGVLLEGFDEPSVSCILMARPTRSRPLYIQAVGRGTRTHPGKTDCLILDLAGVTERHDLTTLADLAGLEPAALDGKTLTEAIAEARATGNQAALELRLPTTTGEIALFRSTMRWLPVGGEPGGFVLPCDRDATLHLVPLSGELWRVEGRRRGQPPKVLGEGLSLEYAQGLGEDVARRFRNGVLARADASWRDRPATPGQLAALKKWRIKPPKGCTRGQASDLLTAKAATAPERTPGPGAGWRSRASSNGSWGDGE